MRLSRFINLVRSIQPLRTRNFVPAPLVRHTSSRMADKEEEAIRRFAEITQTNEALAHSILQDVDYNLETALAQYYAGNDVTAAATKSITSIRTASGEPDKKRLKLVLDEGGEVPPELTLVSYNVDGLDEVNLRRRFTAALVVIAKLNPEVIFLQEVVESIEQEIARSPLPGMYTIFYSKLADLYYCATMVSKNISVLQDDVIPFGSSIMGRSMLVVEAQWHGLRLNLINSHLESMKDYSAPRTEQLKKCIQKMKRLNDGGGDPSRTLTIFGGDLNLRDHEVADEDVDGKEIRDAWIEAGCDSATKFTWDKLLNDNKKDGFKSRCRFDRVYFMRGPYKKVDFSLHGKERIQQIHCFPSDHFAVCCRFHSPEQPEKKTTEEGIARPDKKQGEDS